MSLTDNEIMGGIGFGYDEYSYPDIEDNGYSTQPRQRNYEIDTSAPLSFYEERPLSRLQTQNPFARRIETTYKVPIMLELVPVVGSDKKEKTKKSDGKSGGKSKKENFSGDLFNQDSMMIMFMVMIFVVLVALVIMQSMQVKKIYKIIKAMAAAKPT